MTLEGKELEVQTPEVQTPTAEEQLAQLKSQLELLQSEKAKAEDSYKGLQRTLNKTNDEKQKAVNLRNEIDEIKSNLKVLGSMLVERGQVEENLVDMPQGKKQERLNQWQQHIQQQELKRKEQDQQRQYEEFKQKADTVYQEAETLYGDNVEKLATVRQLIRQGDFDLIDKMISKDKPKETPAAKESEDERINKLVEERFKARLAEEAKKNPLLKTEPAAPSGKGLTPEKVRSQFASGEISADDYYRKKKELNF